MLVKLMIRLLPSRFPGKVRLANLLLKPYLTDGDRQIPGPHRTSFLVPSVREPIAFHLLIDGDYEKATWKAIRPYIPKGGTFLDVGANIGLFTVKAAHAVGPTGSVIAVEASPRIYQYLSRNISQLKHYKVKAHHLALGEYDVNDAAFYEAPLSHFGMGARTPQFGTTSTSIPLRSLDSLLSSLEVHQVDVIKLDVEGFEASVLRGATTVLTNQLLLPVIIFEVLTWAESRAGEVPGESQRILLERGYTLFEVKSNGDTTLIRTRVLPEGMVLALPPKA